MNYLRELIHRVRAGESERRIAGDLLSAAALAIALATNDEGVGMVGETVEGSASQQGVAEHLGPLLEGAIAGDDQ